MAGPRGFEPQISGSADSQYQIPSDLNNLLEQFRTFMQGQLSLCKSTADSNFYLVGKFLREIGSPVTREAVADYLLKIQNTTTRSNYLKALKHYFRDFLGNNIVSSFKLPLPNENPTSCSTDETVKLVYNNLEYERDRLIYSLAATTGLRRGEILNLKRKHIDTENRAIIPHKHTRTKQTGITFYNGEVEPLLRKFLDQLADPEASVFHNGEGAFRKQIKTAWQKAGVKVTLKMLRVWFGNKMGELGVQDRYIDIFCGRAPKSVLAKHYTSKEINKLKEIYGKANLKMLA